MVIVDREDHELRGFALTSREAKVRDWTRLDGPSSAWRPEDFCPVPSLWAVLLWLQMPEVIAQYYGAMIVAVVGCGAAGGRLIGIGLDNVGCDGLLAAGLRSTRFSLGVALEPTHERSGCVGDLRHAAVEGKLMLPRVDGDAIGHRVGRARVLCSCRSARGRFGGRFHQAHQLCFLCSRQRAFIHMVQIGCR